MTDPVTGVAAGLSADSLAALARSTREQVGSLTQLGLLNPAPDGYVSGDVHRIRLVEAFAAAGVPTEALARANAQGTISLAYYDQLHQTPGRPSTRTYSELLAGLGDRAGALRAIFQACGIAEPEVGDRLGQSACRSVDGPTAPHHVPWCELLVSLALVVRKLGRLQLARLHHQSELDQAALPVPAVPACDHRSE